MRSVHLLSAASAIAAARVALLALLWATGAVGPIGLLAGSAVASIGDVLVVRALRRSPLRRLGPGNAVTWARSVLVMGVLAVVLSGNAAGPSRTVLCAAAAVALLLDGVDGRVARATGTVSELGARFDMEVDAALIAVLSIAAAPAVGPWVLLVGAARYLLLIGTWALPWLARPTPPRYWRKVVAAAQGVVLVVVCTRLLPEPAAVAVAVAAAAALAWSFGTQVVQLALASRPAGEREGRGNEIAGPAVRPFCAVAVGRPGREAA